MKGLIFIVGFTCILVVFIATSFALWFNILLAFLSGMIIGWVLSISKW